MSTFHWYTGCAYGGEKDGILRCRRKNEIEQQAVGVSEYVLLHDCHFAPLKIICYCFHL